MTIMYFYNFPAKTRFIILKKKPVECSRDSVIVQFYERGWMYECWTVLLVKKAMMNNYCYRSKMILTKLININSTMVDIHKLT